MLTLTNTRIGERLFPHRDGVNKKSPYRRNPSRARLTLVLNRVPLTGWARTSGFAVKLVLSIYMAEIYEIFQNVRVKCFWRHRHITIGQQIHRTRPMCNRYTHFNQFITGHTHVFCGRSPVQLLFPVVPAPCFGIRRLKESAALDLSSLSPGILGISL